eukprot:5959969-Amphidinium_carterae.2
MELMVSQASDPSRLARAVREERNGGALSVVSRGRLGHGAAREFTSNARTIIVAAVSDPQLYLPFASCKDCLNGMPIDPTTPEMRAMLSLVRP